MKIRLMICMLGLLPLITMAAEIEVTIHVDDAWRPFSYIDEGEAKGMYIDVLKAAFAKMPEFNVKMEAVPWNRAKKMMQQGKGFGLTPVFFHGHDWSYLYPYSLPFYTETIIAVCSEMVLEQPRPRWPEDYTGLAIGNVAGFDGWGGDRFRALVKDGKIDYYEAHSSDALILMLANDRHDCIMMEDLAYDHVVRRLKKSGAYDEETAVKMKKGAIIGTDPVYIGYSEPGVKSGKYPYAAAFRKAFDVIIYRMAKSGEIKRIMEAYQ